MGVKEFIKARPLKARDNGRTNAAELTLKQSVFPIVLVTILFFLWGFSYGKRDTQSTTRQWPWLLIQITNLCAKGLLDTLNKHFQEVLHITRARSAGLQAAYFGCAQSRPSPTRHWNTYSRKLPPIPEANTARLEPILSRQ